MTTCPDCSTELAPLLLTCPGCQRLVHADALKRLAAEAEAATASKDLRTALARWREAQPLLPPGSRQAQAIAAKVEGLVRDVDAGLSVTPAAAPATTSPAGQAPSAATKGGLFAGVATVALLLVKFKAVPLFLLSKGKVLLLGLTKWSTLMSMFVSLGVYWQLFGWTFALGLVLSIYIHEIGHVVALKRFGLKATAPMFIPGLGAFIRMSSYPTTPREDARIGLAGPMWGMGAAAVAYALFLGSGWAGFAAIGQFAAIMNLFNLTPIWQLDGSRGWRALGRWQRWVVAAALTASCFAIGHPLLLLVPIAAIVRLFERPPEEGDRRAFTDFLVLLGGLTLLAAYQVDLPAGG